MPDAFGCEIDHKLRSLKEEFCYKLSHSLLSAVTALETYVLSCISLWQAYEIAIIASPSCYKHNPSPQQRILPVTLFPSNTVFFTVTLMLHKESNNFCEWIVQLLLLWYYLEQRPQATALHIGHYFLEQVIKN